MTARIKSRSDDHIYTACLQRQGFVQRGGRANGSDTAFAKLPPGTVDSLLKPENKEKLKAILTYHVVAGKVPSTEAVKLKTAKTVNGKELMLDASSGKLKVGGANVVQVDIAASNGVIHVVDAVILPSES